MGIYFPKCYMLLRIIINNKWAYVGYQKKWGYNNLVKKLDTALYVCIITHTSFTNPS